jgi:predicted CoA-binding protein
MTHDPTAIRTLLRESRNIAVVGLSTNPDRPSHEVAEYLQMHGYRIIPVNPMHEGASILGEYCYPTLVDAAAALEAEQRRIDIVDCFRRSEAILPIAAEAVAVGARCLWMQLGVINSEAATKAEAAGLMVVMDSCLKIEHRRHAI